MSSTTAIEYGLLTGLVAIGVTTFLSVLGGSVEDAFATMSTQLLSVVPDADVRIVPPDPT